MKSRILICLILALLLSACTLRFASREPGKTLVPTAKEAPSIEAQANPIATATVSTGLTQPANGQLSPTPPSTSRPVQPQARVPLEFPVVEFRYRIQPGTPVGAANFVAPNAGCDWMGVAGQVFDKNSAPVPGLFVVVNGRLAGQEIGPLLAMTGSEEAIGPGGYAIQIHRQALASTGTLFLQLFDVNDMPQSSRIYFDTYANCDQNMILVNFNEAKAIVYLAFLPQAQNSFWPYSLSIPSIGR